jgi:hypothetical protein
MPASGERDNARSPSAACLHFDADLAAYLEGEDRPAVPAHAADCAFCAAVLADLSAIRAAAGDLGLAEPPETLWTGVRAALVREGIIRATRPTEACLRFDAELTSYLEGEERPAVTAHAAECGFCCAVLADLDLIRSAAISLELEEPSARLWANVRSALAEEGIIRSARSSRWSWPAWISHPLPVGALAALILVGLLSLGRGVNLSGRHPPSPAANMAVDPGVQESVREMEGAFRAHTVALDPVIEATFRKDLESLDGEIRECRASLENRPDDGLAREYLAAAYTEKAQILASALDLGNH